MSQFVHPDDRTLRSFMVLWVGQALSLLGSQIVQFALIWWLTRTTGSGTMLALASLVGLLPQVVLGPFVGVLVDRWNRRRVLIVADSVVALATVVLLLLFWSGDVATWQLFAVLFVRALGGTFHTPAMQASTPLMVPQKHLTRIQGLDQMLNGGLNIVAAPIGALLVETLAMHQILLVDIVTAAFAVLPLLAVAIPQPPATPGLTASGFGAQLRAGFDYVRGWRPLLMLIGLVVLLNFVLPPAFSLLPLLVTDHFGGTAYHLSALNVAMSVGIISGGLLLSTWGGFKRRVVTSLVGLAGLGLGTLAIGIAPADGFWFALVGIFVAGQMMSLTNGPLRAILQTVVTPAMQGRVFALIGSAATAMAPLGLAIAGPVADLVGVQAWFVAGGLLSLGAAVAALFMPSLLTLESRVEVDSAESLPVPTAPALEK